jgi:MoaA/NifB/PqqE/SkfB family radical SAM enzyme
MIHGDVAFRTVLLETLKEIRIELKGIKKALQTNDKEKEKKI